MVSFYFHSLSSSFPPSYPPDLNPTMTIFQPGFIFQIQHPILNEEQPGNSSDVFLVEPKCDSRWRVTLSRVKDSLNVAVKLCACGDHIIDCFYVHVIPMNGSEPMMFDFSNEDISARGYMTSCKIECQCSVY